ncbi:MAG: hypothetical protein ABIR53_00095 [Paraperlucidibaca sp.]
MATIAGTPAQLQPTQLPDDQYIDQDDYALNIRPEREFQLPDSFWAVKKLHYRIARQTKPAPLIFLIAGTGANYKNDTIEFLKKVFYSRGYHVVQLSSPTSYDFIAAASHSATPGISSEDAADLMRVMSAVLQDNPTLEFTRIDLAGYSLGALHAAFIAAADAKNPEFYFQHVALLNPPVSLLASTQQLDRLVHVSVPKAKGKDGFFELIFNKLSRFFHEKGGVELSAAVLYDFQRSPEALNNEEMAMLIGSVFRFSAADIVFTSDVVNKRGQIVPTDADLSESASLTPYFRRSLFCDFACYVKLQLLPYWQKKHPEAGLKELGDISGLSAISGYLAASENIHVITNADDLILQPADFAFLQNTFNKRLTVFDHGGHLGNIKYIPYVEKMMSIFND